MWTEDLNSSIDEIARQMMDAPAAGGADFRRRVLARIEAGEAPRRNWRAAWVLAPMGVAMAIVIAIVAARRPGPLGHAGPVDPKGPALQAGTDVQAGTPSPSVAAGTTAASGANGSDRRTAQSVAATVRRPGPFGHGVPAPNGSAPAVAVLAVPPLTVDSIALPPIETDSMPLQTLDAIAPIGVTPLGSPSEGDRP